MGIVSVQDNGIISIISVLEIKCTADLRGFSIFIYVTFKLFDYFEKTKRKCTERVLKNIETPFYL